MGLRSYSYCCIVLAYLTSNLYFTKDLNPRQFLSENFQSCVVVYTPQRYQQFNCVTDLNCVSGQLTSLIPYSEETRFQMLLFLHSRLEHPLFQIPLSVRILVLRDVTFRDKSCSGDLLSKFCSSRPHSRHFFLFHSQSLRRYLSANSLRLLFRSKFSHGEP
jgi:hypothetical protein